MFAAPLEALKIAHSGDASHFELQAAKEVRRYIFLRTGVAPEVISANRYADLPGGDVIFIASDNRSRTQFIENLLLINIFSVQLVQPVAFKACA